MRQPLRGVAPRSGRPGGFGARTLAAPPAPAGDLLSQACRALPRLDPPALLLRATYVDETAEPGDRETVVVQLEVPPVDDLAALARSAHASLLHTLPGVREVERGPLLFADGVQGQHLAYALQPAHLPLTQVHAMRVDRQADRLVLTTLVWTLPYGTPTEALLRRLALTLLPGAAR